MNSRLHYDQFINERKEIDSKQNAKYLINEDKRVQT